jgi:hypothetical protein
MLVLHHRAQDWARCAKGWALSHPAPHDGAAKHFATNPAAAHGGGLLSLRALVACGDVSEWSKVRLFKSGCVSQVVQVRLCKLSRIFRCLSFEVLNLRHMFVCTLNMRHVDMPAPAGIQMVWCCIIVFLYPSLVLCARVAR